MRLARTAFRSHLEQHVPSFVHGPPRVVTPVVAVWPSRTGNLALALLRVPSARVISADTLPRLLTRFAWLRRPADEAIVDALVPLVASLPGRNRRAAA